MKIKVDCSSCNKSVAAPEKYAGQRIKCPNCKSPIRIPQPEPPSAAPAEPSQLTDEYWGDEEPELPPARPRRAPAKPIATPAPSRPTKVVGSSILERSIKVPVVMAVALTALIGGYFGGRWHFQHQLISAVSNAFQDNVPDDNAVGGNDAAVVTKPSGNLEPSQSSVPEFRLGQSYQGELFAVALTKVSRGKMKWNTFSGPETSEDEYLICQFDVKNTDDRKVVNFFGRLLIGTPPCAVLDDAGNTVRQVDFPSSARAEGEGSSEDDIVPSDQSSTVFFFEIPLPKTEHLVMDVNLSTLIKGAEGKLKYKVLMNQIGS